MTRDRGMNALIEMMQKGGSHGQNCNCSKKDKRD